jgi:hypothetical protein
MKVHTDEPIVAPLKGNEEIVKCGEDLTINLLLKDGSMLKGIVDEIKEGNRVILVYLK